MFYATDNEPTDWSEVFSLSSDIGHDGLAVTNWMDPFVTLADGITILIGLIN